MLSEDNLKHLANRKVPVEITGEQFKLLGYAVVDKIADFLKTLPEKPVSPINAENKIKNIIGHKILPQKGEGSKFILNEAADLLFNYTTFNGHPKFFGYITSSAAPIGALADLLASAVNPNVGAGVLSLAATEIETQTIKWIAEFIGYPTNCGGIMVSGGNMANFVAFLSARKAMLNWNVRGEGLNSKNSKQLVIYASTETHTWLQKAADLFGFGTNSIHYIPVDKNQKMKMDELKNHYNKDIQNDLHPFIVVGNAGTVATGAIDDLPAINKFCKENDLWFHVDGAYGAFAAALPDAPEELYALREADSVALDPHKWLYTPLEAGCTLVRNRKLLTDAFSYHPDYYRFGDEDDDAPINYYEYGFQNSRGFRALKVWAALRQAGKDGYIQMIEDDILLMKYLYDLIQTHPELEAVSQSLSITTFRFIPDDLKDKENTDYLNKLNEELLNRLQNSGKVYLSNAVVDGKFVLRACVVNFRTSKKDIEMLPLFVTETGREVDKELRVNK